MYRGGIDQQQPADSAGASEFAGRNQSFDLAYPNTQLPSHVGASHLLRHQRHDINSRMSDSL